MIKILLTLVMLSVSVFADFYIVSGEKKVKMTPLKNGTVDFSTFNKIAYIERGNNELHVVGKEVAFNHRHLNFRLVTLGLKQTNYTITQWSEKAKNSSDTYYINFDNYTRDDGVMLQLFYKNRWYGVVLGNPLKILHKIFLSIDIKSDTYDLKKALVAIKQARRAYPLDDKLKTVEIELDYKKANQEHSRSSKEQNKQIRIFFK